jgi:hypothetical protein
MIDRLIKGYLLLMVAFAGVAAVTVIDDAFQQNADAIWCQPGEQLAYVWEKDASGAVVNKGRKCTSDRAPDQIWERGEDGKPRRVK